MFEEDADGEFFDFYRRGARFFIFVVFELFGWFRFRGFLLFLFSFVSRWFFRRVRGVGRAFIVVFVVCRWIRSVGVIRGIRRLRCSSCWISSRTLIFWIIIWTCSWICLRCVGVRFGFAGEAVVSVYACRS